MVSELFKRCLCFVRSCCSFLPVAASSYVADPVVMHSQTPAPVLYEGAPLISGYTLRKSLSFLIIVMAATVAPLYLVVFGPSAILSCALNPHLIEFSNS